MKILVINNGSSSVKCALYDFPSESLLWEEKGDDLKSIEFPKSVDCIGHRIVHGGKKYHECTKITPDLKKEIRSLADLAPLHNMADLEGIEFFEKLKVPQFAVFDTAFHRTMPEAAKLYPGPIDWYKKGIERFGFHGTSFAYCTKRVEELIGPVDKMVICHLGSGASLCAVKNGKSIDTTMGFTPLEGLMMDTRSGTIDPGIILYLLKTQSAEELSKELYEKSGLLGLSQISSDMRDLLNNKDAKLTLDVYLHRLISCAGSMIASLGGLDALVFTGGIGENTPQIRAGLCKQLSFLDIDLKSNNNSKEDSLLSSPKSKVKVLLIHTNEALEIARQSYDNIASN